MNASNNNNKCIHPQENLALLDEKVEIITYDDLNSEDYNNISIMSKESIPRPTIVIPTHQNVIYYSSDDDLENYDEKLYNCVDSSKDLNYSQENCCVCTPPLQRVTDNRDIENASMDTDGEKIYLMKKVDIKYCRNAVSILILAVIIITGLSLGHVM